MNSADREQELAGLVNETRSKLGLAPLHYDEEISNLARVKATELKSLGCLAQASPMALNQKFNESGLSFHMAKENLAAGQKNASRVLEAWLENPVNSSAIKNVQYNCQGVGFVPGGPHGAYWVQILASR